jgi:signal transduction histidine kinase
MRYSLRWKILFFTVIPPLTLAIATLWIVNRWVTHQAFTGVHESLGGTASAFERVLEAETGALAASARVVAGDERLAHLVARASKSKAWVPAVDGAAKQWASDTPADVFEIYDGRGARIARAGRAVSGATEKTPIVVRALSGQSGRAWLTGHAFQVRAVAIPIREGGRVVGALLLGSELDLGRARELGRLTEADVSFVSGDRVTASTASSESDRRILLEAVKPLRNTVSRSAAEVELVLGDGDRQQVAVVRPLPGTRFRDRQFLVLQRSADGQTAVLRRIRSGLYQLGAITVMVAGMIGWVVSRRVTRPVRQLVRGAEEMQRGNYEFPLDVRSKDELGYLALRFSEMRERERNYVRSLQDVAKMKSEFISVASHELRTPISIIKGFHDLFVQGSLGEMSAKQQKAIARIGDSLVTLTRIAEDATRMAQIESDRMVLAIEEHAARPLIEQGVQLALADAPDRKLEILVEADPELPAVHVDGERLVHAIAHIVRNAIRFTEDGGRIDVQAYRENEQLVMEVRDTGIGIPADRLHDLFARTASMRDSLNHHSSTRLEFNSSGLGLGLPIARGIVEAHGGLIDAESRPGRGSRFMLRIPCLGRQIHGRAA